VLATKVSQPIDYPVRPDTSPFGHRSFLFYQIHIAAVPCEAVSGYSFFYKLKQINFSQTKPNLIL
jgi:hypothetical protein